MLYPNGQRALCYPGRHLAGSLAASGALAYGGISGAALNRFVTDTTSKVLGGMPTGYSARSYRLPIKAGAMAAWPQEQLVVNATASGVLGMPGTGSASFAIQIADAAGQMIVSGSGSAIATFSTNTPLLTASINGSGTAALSISVTPALLGAIADGAGAGAFAITAAPFAAYPLDASSPLRTGAASITFSGALVPYAVGSMAGSTVDTTTLTSDAIANAVWAAVAAANNATGSMGGKLNSAASGGVDYTALAQAVLTQLQATAIPVNMVQVRGQALAGSGSESDPWGPNG